MELQESKRNKGGRPVKQEAEKATIKLNCWVTYTQNEQIQSDYVRAKAGTKLSFAAYLKQKLLSKWGVARLKTDELLLTVLINLQERGRQLDSISQDIASENGDVSKELDQRITEELAAIQNTLTSISRWLYKS